MPTSAQPAFWTTEQGRQFTSAGFGNWFRECCDEAGLPHCSAHGLRKAAATRMAEHGATTHQLMSWFGWTSVSERANEPGVGRQDRSRTEIVKPQTQFDKMTSK